MIKTGFFQRGQAPQRAGEIAGIGGRAGLVGDHFYFVARGHQAQHGVHEIAALFGIKPGGAHNQALRMFAADDFFTFIFAAAICIERMGRGVLAIRRSCRTVEYKIGGEMDQARAMATAQHRQCAGALRIHCPRLRFMALRAVDVGIAGGIDHQRRADGIEPALQLCGIGDVATSARRRGDVRAFGRSCRQRPAQLAAAAQDQAFHAGSSACASVGALASLGESSRSALRGQAMARAGSFQAMARSNSGA